MSRGRRRKGDPVDGILLLDKPTDISSNFALQKAKRLLNAQKAGHTGSLDPIATGLLPLCFGKATKVSELLLGSDKTYEVDIILGVETDSGDREGEVINRSPVLVELAAIREVLERFQGTIQQIPPMHSALKRDGQPLYKLARKGITVERAPRTVTVYELSILSFDSPRLKLSVTCSKGFYIRSLAQDIGQQLETGAHVDELRRTAVGSFSIADAVTLHQLENMTDILECRNSLTPTDQALLHLPRINLTSDLITGICQGRMVQIPEQADPGLSRVYSPEEKFIGLADITAMGTAIPKRIFI